MRFTRLIIGFLIIVVAVFVIAGEQLAGVSSNAFINARTTMVRAPIAGEVAIVPRLLGSRVVAGEEVATIRNRFAGSATLDDLLRELASVRAEAGRLEVVLARQPDQGNAEMDDETPQGVDPGPSGEDLTAELEATQVRLEALERRIESERLRIVRRSSATLVSNVNGQLWEVLAASGEHVQAGDPLLRLVDCDSSGVTLSVSESVYNRLHHGDSADFRVSGDSRIFSGTITRLAGSGAETIYRNLAIPPSARHLERFDVTLYVPDLREDEELKCAIGRTGRVFFEARPLDFLRRLWE